MLHRRKLLAVAAGGLAAPWVARAAAMPGVTKTSIKIGQTIPYSGPASAYGVMGRAQSAFFKMLNATGGIGGRTIEFLSVDDGYSPPRTVEETRRLIESEDVACLFGSLGTACQTAVRQYLNARKVPQLFVNTGADKWADPEHFPWTMGFFPSYRTEAQVFAKHMQRNATSAKLAILYQNDDFGRDYVAGVRDVLGPQYDKTVIRTASYEVTDPTVDSQIVDLQASGADMLLTAATAKPAAQAIRKIAEIGWHPLHYLSYVSTAPAVVLIPAGAENARGIIGAVFLKVAADPQWADDAGLATWRALAEKWLPGENLNDLHTSGYAMALALKQVLEQCGDDLSRENIMRQAGNLHDLEIPVLLPGIKVNTSPANFHPIRQMQLARWTGTSWERFGDVLEGTA
ncbi:MAG: ABC transporter substrate-binding protein [Acetobacteraceae bacterium]|nr:ABC transporter substrate-binding protein [Acetobacteraceae bacterium]